MFTSVSHGTALIATAVSAGFVLFAGPHTTALRATAVLAAVAQVVAIMVGALPSAALAMTAGTIALPWLRRRPVAVLASGVVAVLLAVFAAGDVPAMAPADHHTGAAAPETGRYALTVLLWLAVTAGLGAAARLAARGRWLAFPVVVVTAAAIVVVPPQRDAGTPVLASVTVADRRLPVLVAPGRPGWNLVHVGAPEVSVAGVAAATARPGAGDSWAEVWLPAGSGRISVTHNGFTGSIEILTGDRAGGPDLRGPDGPECAHSALGGVIGGNAAGRSTRARRTLSRPRTRPDFVPWSGSSPTGAPPRSDCSATTVSVAGRRPRSSGRRRPVRSSPSPSRDQQRIR